MFINVPSFENNNFILNIYTNLKIIVLLENKVTFVHVKNAFKVNAVYC